MNDSFPQLQTHTESSKLSYSSLVIKHKIASGLTADIYLSSLADSPSDDEYVIKIFHRKSDKFYMNEINFLKNRITHPNLIKVYDWGLIKDQDDHFYNHHYIIMEYIKDSDLVHLIENSSVLHNEKKVRAIVLGVIEGLTAMHQRGFIHRDIKPENILVSEIDKGNSYNVKITDFGFVDGIKSISKEKKGTRGYMSPEVINRCATSAEGIDVFSLGVLTFILLTSEFPFDSPTKDDELYSLIIEEKWDEYWKKVGHIKDVSTEAKQMIQGMICEDTHKRLSFEQLRNCAWIKKVTPS